MLDELKGGTTGWECRCVAAVGSSRTFDQITSSFDPNQLAHAWSSPSACWFKKLPQLRKFEETMCQRHGFSVSLPWPFVVSGMAFVCQ